MISLENSVRQNKAAMTVLNSLSKGAVFELDVENCEKTLVSREKDGVSFKNVSCGEKPDFAISMPENVFIKLFSNETSSLSTEDYLAFSAKFMSSDENRKKIDLVIHANFLKLTLHGYPKLIKLGGMPFLKVLKENGIGSLFAIEKKLATFRNK